MSRLRLLPPFFVLILTLTTKSVSGTNSVSPAAMATRSLSMEIYKAINLDGWNTSLFYSTAAGQGGTFSFADEYDIQLHRIRRYHSRWKATHDANLELTRPLNERWGLTMTGDLYRFSDQATKLLPLAAPPSPFYPSFMDVTPFNSSYPSGGSGDVEKLFFGAGANYANSPKFTGSLRLGPAFESRGEESLQGIRADANISNVSKLGDIELDGWAKRYRSSTDFKSSSSLRGLQKLAGGGSDTYTASYYYSRQRENTSQGAFSGRRVDRDLHVRNLLSNAPDSEIGFSWESELQRKTTSHLINDSESRDLSSDWNNRVEVDWSRGSASGTVGGGLDLQNLKYRNSLAHGRLTFIDMSTTFTSKLPVSTIIQARTSIYRYDTPDTTEYSDRDEVRYVFTIIAAEQVYDNLRIRLTAELDLHHLVYIFSERSGDNRWTRLFTLSCDIPWGDQRLRNRARFGVAANYTDYDYIPYESESSRVYRSFSADDTLQLDINDYLTMQLAAAALIDDYGNLLWRDWVQDVNGRGRSFSATGIPTFRLYDYLVGAGWTWHRRRSTVVDGAGSPEPSEDVRSQGPVVSIRKPGATTGPRLELYGAWLTVDDVNRGRYEIPDVTFRFEWTW